MLWPGRSPGSSRESSFRPWLDPYLLRSRRPRGLVVVCPGGGYYARATQEEKPIARMFNRMGLHAAVVHYRVRPDYHPAPLMDAARAVRIVRRNARRWKVDPDQVAICGFSAGGHLAASLGVHYGKAPAGVNDVISRQSCRPDAMVICYAVISSRFNRGCFVNLLGSKPSRAMMEMMSLERHVGPHTPPAFIWHTVEDQMVPVAQATMFADALRGRRIPHELHLFPKGRHGMGLAKDDPHVASWTRLCAGFFGTMGILD